MNCSCAVSEEKGVPYTNDIPILWAWLLSSVSLGKYAVGVNDRPACLVLSALLRLLPRLLDVTWRTCFILRGGGGGGEGLTF